MIKATTLWEYFYFNFNIDKNNHDKNFIKHRVKKSQSCLLIKVKGTLVFIFWL